jgi:hypothetical protein
MRCLSDQIRADKFKELKSIIDKKIVKKNPESGNVSNLDAGQMGLKNFSNK